MRRYYKRTDAESDLGSGVAYMEITDGWPTRQVELYGDTWRWGDEANSEHLADQPFDSLDLDAEHEIPAEEFEQAWRDARKQTAR